MIHLKFSTNRLTSLLSSWEAELFIDNVPVSAAAGTSTPSGVEVSRIFTKLAKRRKGYATLLLKELCTKLKVINCIPETVDPSNKEAVAFWKKFSSLYLPECYNKADSDIIDNDSRLDTSLRALLQQQQAESLDSKKK